MLKFVSPLIFAAGLLVLGPAAPAQAARINQAWVSGHGTDSASCGPSTSPCRTFQYTVHNILASGGEIDVMDPADYGPVTITFPLGIVNDNVGAATIRQAAAQPGITISVAAAGGVYLRGLTIDGFGVGTAGIQFNAGASLDIAKCVVRHFKGNGINLIPTTTSTFSITDTFVSADDNTSVGIKIFPQGAAGITGFIKAVTSKNNFDGILLDALNTTAAKKLDVTVVDSVAANNFSIGFYVASASGHPAASMALRNVVASDNNMGVRVDGPGGIALLAHSVIDGNSYGTVVTGGKIYTYGDNNFSNNATPHSGALTSVSPE
jgi:hypothetical protein